MKYYKRLAEIIVNYGLARLLKRPSAAAFWYLPERSNIKSKSDLLAYQNSSKPFYLMDYTKKLSYGLYNESGIIVLPYVKPIGYQVNPEAAFQYALGLHDYFQLHHDEVIKDKFLKYSDYFVSQQNSNGAWSYHFDWYHAKAPWSSALAQARGACVLLRAWFHTKDVKYVEACKKALSLFSVATQHGGYLHFFAPANCYYFEEYPQMPTGVINGFMASLMNIWELKYWLKEPWLEDLWRMGITSLIKMLPFYNTGWWSVYDLDPSTPILNVNSPRYHLLEMEYLQILALLSGESILMKEYELRKMQYHNVFYRCRAYVQKLLRKISYK